MTNLRKNLEWKPILDKNISWLSRNTIFLVVSGSHAYGLNIPESDLDIKGISIPPKEYFIGYLNRFEQAEIRDPIDAVIYEIRKFFSLAADCNPNIIEVLNVDPGEVIYSNSLGEELQANKDLFLSKKAKHTFSGYAAAQAKRIKLHHKWLRNPPLAPPVRADFGLPEQRIVQKGQLEAVRALIRKQLDSWDVIGMNCQDLDNAGKIRLREQAEATWTEIISYLGIESDLESAAARKLGCSDNFIELLVKEKAYQGQQDNWRAYQNWKASRNPVRAEMEAKFGFDGKHGLHLVRLMKMCREILSTGKVIVKRTNDREELLSIRQGAWTFDQLMEWFEQEDKEMWDLYQNSKLPHSPPRIVIDNLCQRLVSQHLSLE